MKIIIEKSERDEKYAKMSDTELLVDFKDESRMYEIFCRPSFANVISKVKSDDLFSLVYFWYSCEFGMQLETLIPKASELFKYDTTAKCDADINIFELVYDDKEEEKVEEKLPVTEENAKIVRQELIGRLTYIHERLITIE